VQNVGISRDDVLSNDNLVLHYEKGTRWIISRNFHENVFDYQQISRTLVDKEKIISIGSLGLKIPTLNKGWKNRKVHSFQNHPSHTKL
jgi:hypothetical protein